MANNVTVNLTLKTTDRAKAKALVAALGSCSAFDEYCKANGIGWNGYWPELSDVTIRRDDKSTIKFCYDESENTFTEKVFADFKKLGFDVIAYFYDEGDYYAVVSVDGERIEVPHWRAHIHYKEAYDYMAQNDWK